jgi:proteic killer suppression protein
LHFIYVIGIVFLLDGGWMEVLFRTKRLQKVCNSEQETISAFGRTCGRLLQRRLVDLAAATSLAELSALPQTRCHPLKGQREGQFAVNLEHPRRLILEPAHDPVPLSKDGGIDLQRITRVWVVEVVDYH